MNKMRINRRYLNMSDGNYVWYNAYILMNNFENNSLKHNLYQVIIISKIIITMPPFSVKPNNFSTLSSRVKEVIRVIEHKQVIWNLFLVCVG